MTTTPSDENSTTLRCGDLMYEVYFGDGKMTIFRGNQSLTAAYDDWKVINGFLYRRFVKKERSPSTDGPANHGEPWTDELDAILAKRWNEGASVGELCDEFERSERGIISRLTKLDMMDSGFSNLRKAAD